MKFRLILYGLCVGLFALTSACKSLKRTQEIEGPIGRVSKKEVLDHFAKQKRDYASVEIKKFDATYVKGDETKNFKGFVRFQPQRAVMVSIAPVLGIEMFRLLSQQDSLGFIDRYNKEYYHGDYGFLKRKLGLDYNFDLVQVLVSADLNNLPREFQPQNGFKLSFNENFVVLSKLTSFQDSRFLVEYNFDKSMLLKRIFIKDFSRGNFVEVMYRKYFDDVDGVFPKRILVNANNGASLLKFSIEFKSIVFDKTLNFPFSVSPKYKRIEI